MNLFQEIVNNPWFKIGLQHSSRLSLYNDKYISAPEMYLPQPSEVIYGNDYYGYRTCNMTKRIDGSVLYTATYGGNGARIISGNLGDKTYGRGSKNYVGEIPKTIVSDSLAKYKFIGTLPKSITSNEVFKKAYNIAVRDGLFQFLVFNENGIYRYGSIIDYVEPHPNSRIYNALNSPINPEQFEYRGIIKGSINKGDYLVFIDPVSFIGYSYNGKEILEKTIVDDDFVNGSSSINVYHITSDEFENERYINVLVFDDATNEWKNKLLSVKDNYLFELYPLYDALGINYNNNVGVTRNTLTGFYEPDNLSNALFNWTMGRELSSNNTFKQCNVYNGRLCLYDYDKIDSTEINFLTPGPRVEKEDYKNYTGISIVSTKNNQSNLKIAHIYYDALGVGTINLETPAVNTYLSRYKNIYVENPNIKIKNVSDEKVKIATPKFTMRKAKDMYSEIARKKGNDLVTEIRYRLNSDAHYLLLIAELHEMQYNTVYEKYESVRIIDSIVLDRVNKDFIDFNDLKFQLYDFVQNDETYEIVSPYISKENLNSKPSRPLVSKTTTQEISDNNFFRYLDKPMEQESYFEARSLKSYREDKNSIFYTIQPGYNLRFDYDNKSNLKLKGPILYSTYQSNTEENPFTSMFPENDELLMSVPSNPGYMYFEQFVVGGPQSSGSVNEGVVEIPKEDLTFTEEKDEEGNEKPRFETPEIDVSSGPKTEEIKKNEDLTEEEEEQLKEQEEQTSGGKNTEVEVDVRLVVDEDKLEEEGIELPKDEDGNEYIEVEIEVEVTDSLGNKHKIKKRIFYVNPRGKNNKNKGMFDLSSLGLPDNVIIDSMNVTIIPEDEKLKDKLELEVKITIKDIINPVTQQNVLDNPALKLNGIIELGQLRDYWTITGKSLSGNTKKIKLSDMLDSKDNYSVVKTRAKKLQINISDLLTTEENYVIIKTRSNKESVVITNELTAEENYVINKEEVV